MNRLKGLGAYLSGPIDYASDRGAAWRERITPFLKEMNVTVFNPLDHKWQGVENLAEKRQRMEVLRQNNQFKELREEMKELIRWDLRAVDISSFLICNYDSNVHMCGTYEEIFLASKQKKAVLLVHSKPRHELSSWMYGRFDPQYFFASWDELKEYLTKINSDPNYRMTEADSKRWLFFDRTVISAEQESNSG